MTFKQKPFMRSYIVKNTELRKSAKNEFEKDFFKLMNNSCFGKTMENVRNRIEFKLFSVEPTDKMKRKCKKWIPMGDTLIGMHMFKTKVILDKPIYVGASILDLSKLHMQKFHYDVVKPNLGDKADLLFTDTDSLCYHIRGTNAYEFMHAHKEHFDMSSFFPKDSKYYNTENNGVLGKFKIDKEFFIKEFVGLRPKCYAVLPENSNKSSATCKGVKKSVAKNECTFQHYKHVLFTRNKFRVNQSGFQVRRHEISTIEIDKCALSAFDNKRWVSDDNIYTRSFGYKE